MSARLLRIPNWEHVAKKADFEPATMAKLCRISILQLQRFFAEQFHQTPEHWIREVRFLLAKELLTKGLSTKSVATELKFANASHFCHEFKKFYGSCPQMFSPKMSL